MISLCLTQWLGRITDWSWLHCKLPPCRDLKHNQFFAFWEIIISLALLSRTLAKLNQYGPVDAAWIQWNTEIPIDWIGLDDLHQQELSASLKIVLVEQRHVWLERDRKREKVEVLCLLGFLSTSLWGDLSATQPFPDSPTCVTRRLGNKLSKKTSWSTNFPKNGKQADQQSTRLLMQAISHRKCFKISQTKPML